MFYTKWNNLKKSVSLPPNQLYYFLVYSSNALDKKEPIWFQSFDCQVFKQTRIMPCVYVCMCSDAQSCPVLCNPVNCITRLLCPWDSPSKNTGVGCHFFLLGIFPTQGSNSCLLCLLHWQVGPLPLAPLGKPQNNVINMCRSINTKVIHLRWY